MFALEDEQERLEQVLDVLAAVVTKLDEEVKQSQDLQAMGVFPTHAILFN